LTAAKRGKDNTGKDRMKGREHEGKGKRERADKDVRARARVDMADNNGS
jgi:hypothetical protein